MKIKKKNPDLPTQYFWGHVTVNTTFFFFRLTVVLISTLIRMTVLPLRIHIHTGGIRQPSRKKSQSLTSQFFYFVSAKRFDINRNQTFLDCRCRYFSAKIIKCLSSITP